MHLMPLKKRRYQIRRLRLRSTARHESPLSQSGWNMILDLRTGWDLREESHRNAAMEYVRRAKPWLVSGIPECTTSTKSHIKFAVPIYREQVASGRWFIHERPTNATSLNLREVQQDSVASSHEWQMCTHSYARRADETIPVLAKKRTRFLTNSDELAGELSRQRGNQPTHLPPISDRTERQLSTVTD